MLSSDTQIHETSLILFVIFFYFFTANVRIRALADRMNIMPRLAERAHRMFTLALEKNFTRGRRANLVAASCLYIICRQEKTPRTCEFTIYILQI